MSRWRVVVVGRRWFFGRRVTAVRYEDDMLTAWQAERQLCHELEKEYGARRFESSVTKEHEAPATVGASTIEGTGT